MDIHERLVHIVENATSPAGALHAAATAIADDQGSDACAVFLRGPQDRLVLWVYCGEGFDDAVREVVETMADTALASVLPEALGEPVRALIAAPLLLHAQLIGALVVKRAGGLPYSAAQVRKLSAVASQIVGIIEGARLVETVEGPDVPEQ